MGRNSYIAEVDEDVDGGVFLSTAIQKKIWRVQYYGSGYPIAFLVLAVDQKEAIELAFAHLHVLLPLRKFWKDEWCAEVIILPTPDSPCVDWAMEI